jgi:hypothetical protein
VRPSPGAASPEGATTLKFSRAFWHFHAAAPEDGRTPQAQPPLAVSRSRLVHEEWQVVAGEPLMNKWPGRLANFQGPRKFLRFTFNSPNRIGVCTESGTFMSQPWFQDSGA